MPGCPDRKLIVGVVRTTNDLFAESVSTQEILA